MLDKFVLRYYVCAGYRCQKERKNYRNNSERKRNNYVVDI